MRTRSRIERLERSRIAETPPLFADFVRQRGLIGGPIEDWEWPRRVSSDVGWEYMRTFHAKRATWCDAMKIICDASPSRDPHVVSLWQACACLIGGTRGPPA